MRYWGDGVGAGDPVAGLAPGAVEAAGAGERSNSFPDDWQPASRATTRATEAARAIIGPA
jgi:hypothetical protein